MPRNNAIVVYGAAGHTGRFVVVELQRRGFSPVLAGRDPAKLDQVGAAFPGLEKRVAPTTDPAALDRAFAGTAIVINCAGPFIDTAPAVIEAALRAGAHYLDIAAEQAAVHHVFETFDSAARSAGVVVVPANGFYGGLGDLLATVAMGEWSVVDGISIAVALDSWLPTRGTRLTGERNPGQRYHFTNGKLERRDPFPLRSWDFPPPFGHQEVASLALAEAILIPHHLRTREVRLYLNTRSLADLRDPATPEPVPADDSGRSSQIFIVEAAVRRNGQERRVSASGRDIYAITAPIVAEAAERLLAERPPIGGVRAMGELFDAPAFLRALSPDLLLAPSHGTASAAHPGSQSTW